MKCIAIVAAFIPLFVFGQIRNTHFGNPVLEGNEPSIAINPTNKNDIWLGYNTSNLFHSVDAGKTWESVNTNTTHGYYGDPVLKFSNKGIIYFTHLAKNKSKKWPTWFDCIVFERSLDGKVFESTCVASDKNKMQDKPWFSIDEGLKSKYHGNLYLTWTEFDKYGSSNKQDSTRVKFAKSSDDGLSFSNAITVSDKSGGAEDDDNTSEGVTTSVLNDGTILCFWSRADTLWMDKSLDAGKTWGIDQAICRMPGGWNFEKVKGLVRTNGMPFAIADKNNNIYVTFACQNEYRDFDIYYVYSGNNGKSFEGPIVVNDDKLEGVDQFSPYLVLNEKLENPKLIWYDKRNSEKGHFADIYSADLCKKRPSKNIKLTNEPIILPGKDEFMGDYVGLSVVQGRAIAAVTAFDDDIRKPCIQLIDWQAKLKKTPNEKDPILLVNRNFKSDSLVVLVSFPQETSFTFEIKSVNGVVMTSVFEIDEPQKINYQEMYIRKSMLGHGLYTFIVRRKGKIYKKSIWLD